MLSALLLVVALCIDSFATSFSYGINKIKIPFASAAVINLVGACFLALSLFAASIISQFIPHNICVIISFAILFIMGISSMFQNIIKSLLRRLENPTTKLHFSFFDIRFVLDVYLDETKADIDNSKTLSVKESCYLALALSLDSLAAGFGSGLSESNYALTIAMAIVLGFIAIYAGGVLGRKAGDKLHLNISWVSGAILIILAFMKIL